MSVSTVPRTAIARERPVADPEPRIECAKCGCNHFITIDTRLCIGGQLHRLKCRHCGRPTTRRENKIQPARQLAAAD